MSCLFAPRLLLLGALLWLGGGLAAPVAAQTASWIDWAADDINDGYTTGTIVNHNTATPAVIAIELTNTPVSHNAGNPFNDNWSSKAGTNDVPGITAAANTSGVTLVGSSTNPATNILTISANGNPYSVLNPVLLFDWIGAGTTYLFSDVPDVPGAIVLIDHNLAVAPTITGNRVTASGAAPGIALSPSRSKAAIQG